MAKHDERRYGGLRVQARELGGYGSHGDQFGAGDSRNLEFGGLADVEEGELFAGCNAALNFLGSDFERRGWRH